MWLWDFFFEERFLIGHGSTPVAYIPTYVLTYIPLHSTSQSGVEQILSSTTKMVPLHSRMYLCTNVHYNSLAYVPTYECTFHPTPHHRVEWKKKIVWIHTKSQMLQKKLKKNHQTLKKPEVENIARRWKSQMLKKLPDAEKASNLLPVARVC